MKVRVFIFALLLVSVSACSTKIEKVKQDAALLDNQVVTVSGKVISTTNLVVMKYFKLQDSSGQIAIISKQALPSEGESLTIKGTVHQYMKVGNTSMTVIKELERNKSWF